MAGGPAAGPASDYLVLPAWYPGAAGCAAGLPGAPLGSSLVPVPSPVPCGSWDEESLRIIASFDRFVGHPGGPHTRGWSPPLLPLGRRYGYPVWLALAVLFQYTFNILKYSTVACAQCYSS